MTTRDGESSEAEDETGREVPQGFAPNNISGLDDEQEDRHRQRLREKFVADQEQERRRRRVIRIVLPIAVALIVLAAFAAVGERIFRKRQAEAAEEAWRAADAIAAENRGVDAGALVEARDRFLWGGASASDEALSDEERQAWTMIRSGERGRARAMVDQIALRQPGEEESDEISVLRGAVNLVEDSSRAKDRALQVLAGDPAHGRALDLLAAAYQMQRSRALSREEEIRFREREVTDYARLLEADPNLATVLLRSAFQRIALHRLDPGRPEELDNAISELKRLITVLKSEKRSELAVGRARHHLGRAYRHRADRFRSEGDGDGAAEWYALGLAEFSRALGLNSNDVESMGQMILIHRTEGRRDEAIHEANGALALMTDTASRARLQEMIGGLHMETGDRVAAAAAFEASLDINAGQPAALLYLVKLKVEDGDHEVAAKMLSRGIERIPDFLEAHVLLGEIHRERERPEEAKTAFERALAVVPERAVLVDKSPSFGEARTRYYREAATNLAWYHLLDRPDSVKARESLGRALSHGGDSSELQHVRAWIHYLEGNFRAAAAMLTSVVAESAEGDALQARYHLAASLWKTGDREDALRELEEALATGESFRGRAKAEALRQEIRDAAP